MSVWRAPLRNPARATQKPFRATPSLPTRAHADYDFEPASFARGDPTFALPASPKCVPVGHASTAAEAHALVSAASPALATLHLTEVFASALPPRK